MATPASAPATSAPIWRISLCKIPGHNHINDLVPMPRQHLAEFRARARMPRNRMRPALLCDAFRFEDQPARQSAIAVRLAHEQRIGGASETRGIEKMLDHHGSRVADQFLAIEHPQCKQQAAGLQSFVTLAGWVELETEARLRPVLPHQRKCMVEVIGYLDFADCWHSAPLSHIGEGIVSAGLVIKETAAGLLW